MEKKIMPLLFILIILKQIVWIAVLPIFHTPDEQAHFAQVQNLAEGTTPGKLSTSAEIAAVEKYLDVFRDAGGNNRFTYHPEYRIEYAAAATGKYENRINSIPRESRKKLVINEATWYPPLYYQFAALGYKIASFSDLIGRIYFVRIWQMFIYLANMLLFYLAAKTIFTKKSPAVFFTIAAAFLPMPSFVGSGVTSDNLMNLLFTAVIFILLLIIKNGINKKYFIFLGLILVLGVQTKPHFVIAVPIVFAALVIRLILENKMKIVFFGIPLFVFAMAMAAMLMSYTKKTFYADLADVIFAKNRVEMPLVKYFFITLSKTYRETIPWFWGIYRWLSLAIPRIYYRIWNLFSLPALVFFVIYLVQNARQKKSIKFYQLLFLALAAVIYYLALFVWDYLFFLSVNFSFGLQGRYFFPILFPIGFLLFYFLRVSVLRLLFVVYCVFINFYTLIYLAASYYDFSSPGAFIMQMSQYKPWYFKDINLAMIFISYLAVFLIFLIQLTKYAKEKH